MTAYRARVSARHVAGVTEDVTEIVGDDRRVASTTRPGGTFVDLAAVRAAEVDRALAGLGYRRAGEWDNRVEDAVWEAAVEATTSPAIERVDVSTLPLADIGERRVYGPARRLAAALETMAARRDEPAELWLGELEPAEPERLAGIGEPSANSYRLVWTSPGGIFSSRAWRLDADIHTEVCMEYGDTLFRVTAATLAVVGRGRRSATIYHGAGLEEMVTRPLRAYLLRRALRGLAGLVLEGDYEHEGLPPETPEEWCRDMLA